MKKTALLLPLLVAGMLSCNNTPTENNNPPKADSTPVAAETPKEAAPPAPPMDSATIMKKMQEYGTPGDMHKMLAARAGKWSAEMTLWMDPAKPPTKETVTAERKMIMNGLYMQETVKGSMMGRPFEGVATTGYDNTKKVFVSSWVDNISSGMMKLDGTMDEATKSITFKGTMTDCTTGGDAQMRQVVTYIDDKNETMTSYYTGADGKEVKSMEIRYTKK